MSGKKILIVDDDQDLVLGLSLRLKASGYHVTSASDGASAVEMARKEGPELVILDLGLPAGDGFVVLQRIKEIAGLKMTPVIVLSGRDPTGNEDRVRDAGATAFLQKPPDNRELLATIRHALGEATGLSSIGL